MPARTQVRISNHCVDRFRERVAPHLDHSSARRILAERLKSAKPVQSPPHWALGTGGSQHDNLLYLMIDERICVTISAARSDGHPIASTVLTENWLETNLTVDRQLAEFTGGRLASSVMFSYSAKRQATARLGLPEEQASKMLWEMTADEGRLTKTPPSWIEQERSTPLYLMIGDAICLPIVRADLSKVAPGRRAKPLVALTVKAKWTVAADLVDAGGCE